MRHSIISIGVGLGAVIAAGCYYCSIVSSNVRHQGDVLNNGIGQIAAGLDRQERLLAELSTAIASLGQCIRQVEAKNAADLTHSRGPQEVQTASEPKTRADSQPTKRPKIDGQSILEAMTDVEKTLIAQDTKKFDRRELATILREKAGVQIDPDDPYNRQVLGTLLLKHRAELDTISHKHELGLVAICKQLDAAGSSRYSPAGTALPAPETTTGNDDMVINRTVQSSEGVRQYTITSSEFPEVLQVMEHRKEAFARLLTEAGEYLGDQGK